MSHLLRLTAALTEAGADFTQHMDSGNAVYVVSSLGISIAETTEGHIVIEGLDKPSDAGTVLADLIKVSRARAGQTDQLLSSPSVLLLQDMRATLYKREDTRQYHICRETTVGKKVPRFSESPPLPNLPLAMMLYVEALDGGMKATAAGMAEALEMSAQKLSSDFGGESPMDLLKSIFTKK